GDARRAGSRSLSRRAARGVRGRLAHARDAAARGRRRALIGSARRATLVPWARARSAAATLAMIALSFAPAARAQDFAGPPSPGAEPRVWELLDRALPPPTASFSAAATQTRWWDVPGLETRAVAACAGWRSWRGSLGLSQTGEPELGWAALALALGSRGRDTGARGGAVTRRDRDAPWSRARAFRPGAGVEVGAGAWLVAAPGVRVWASAPQMWTGGAAPPLPRPLELGVSAGRGTGAWVRLVAPGA